MSQSRRVESLMQDAQEHRREAWEPLVNYVEERTRGEVSDAVRESHRHWKQLSQEDRAKAWLRLPEHHDDDWNAAWNEWARALNEAVEEKGVSDDLAGLWPQQVPQPPEEPAGLWDELHGMAEGKDGEGPITRAAASRALLWLAIARSLRHFGEWDRNRYPMED